MLTPKEYVCAVCNKLLPDYRSFIDHYRESHTDRVKRYDINNKRFKQKALVYAPSQRLALEGLGWQEIDCKIKVVE